MKGMIPVFRESLLRIEKSEKAREIIGGHYTIFKPDRKTAWRERLMIRQRQDSLQLCEAVFPPDFSPCAEVITKPLRAAVQ
jgi:hypothetical protein